MLIVLQSRRPAQRLHGKVSWKPGIFNSNKKPPEGGIYDVDESKKRLRFHGVDVAGNPRFQVAGLVAVNHPALGQFINHRDNGSSAL